MELLRSIIPILGELSNDYIETAFQNFNAKEKQAVKIITRNSNLSSSELNSKLARDIYNVNYTSPTYRSFKATLENKIIKIASLIESKGSDIQKKRFMIHQSYTAMYHMIMLGLRKPAIILGKQVLKNAVKYHDYTTAKNACRLLVRHYGTFGDKKSHQDYVQKYEYFSSIIALEHECELKYGKLVHEMKRNNISAATRLNTEQWLDSVKHKLDTESADFHYYYYQIRLKLCKEGEYDIICKNAINYFENLYFNHSGFISIFKNILLQNRFKNGDISLHTIKTLISVRNLVEKYGGSWYLSSLSLAKIYLNRGNFTEANTCIKKVLKSKKYRFIPKDHRNEWQLIQMYYYLMTGKYDEVNIRKIKYNLNYDKTKKSSDNIPFLIGELIYLLKTGETELDRKINHLRNTIKNQCKGNELERGLGFCNAVQKGQKFVAKKAEKSFESEYVFYEKLLEKV